MINLEPTTLNISELAELLRNRLDAQHAFLELQAAVCSV